MLWEVVFVIALAVGQVPAAPQAQSDLAIFPENIEYDRDSRIVSGWDAQPGQHPHHISLRMVGGDGAVFSCGASLVSREWAITAAHCTATRVTVVVRAGVVDVTRPQYIAETTEYYNHPTYNSLMPSVVQPNDIGLLKLPRPVVYSNLLKAIRVQSTADAHRNYEGLVTITSGHGLTWTGGFTSEILQWVYMTAISNNDCFRTFGSVVTDNTICVRFFNVTSQSTCSGDSGGPLVHVDNEGVPILIGVTSFVAGSLGCHLGYPAGFIRTGPFHSWFTEITGLDFENLVEEDEVTEPPVTEPPVTEPPVTEPPVTEPPATEPPATEPPATEPPVTEPPVTDPPVTEPEPEESEEDGDDSSEEDDPELSELLKKLEVQVKVKVKMGKYGYKHKHSHNKTISVRPR